MTNPGAPLPPVPPVTPPSPLPRGDVRATVLGVTGSLQNLPRPAQVTGQIVQDNQDGSVVIRTDQGDVTARLRTPQPAAQGQQVQIDLSAGNPPRQAIVRAAPDSPPEPQASSTPPASSAPGSSSGSAPSPGTAPSSSPPPQTSGAPVTSAGSSATATPASSTGTALQTAPAETGAPPPPRLAPALLPPLPETAAVPAQPSPLQPNQPVRLLLLSPQAEILPAAPGLPGMPTPLPAQAGAFPRGQAVLPSAGTPAVHEFPFIPQGLPSGIPAQTATDALPSSFFGRLNAKLTDLLSGMPLKNAAPLPEQLLPGQLLPGQSAPAAALAPALSNRIAQFDAQVKAVLPPGAAPEPQATPGASLTATVIGFTRQGLPVVSVPLPGNAAPQSFVLQFPAAGLNAGDQITLAPQLSMAPETGLAPLSLDAGDDSWPALQAANAALVQAAPQAAQMLAQALPNPAAPLQLPPAALIFIAAVQSGDLSGWLGDKTLDLLRRAGKADIVSRLAGDLDIASRASTQGVAQDWKALPLPLYYEGHIDKAMLWFRQDGGKDKDDDQKNKQTRFVLNLNLTRMGAVQFDGLAKQQRIDLIVRTVRPVSDGMRQYMRQRYLNALDRITFSGELSFQDRPDQFVKFDPRKAGSGARI